MVITLTKKMLHGVQIRFLGHIAGLLLVVVFTGCASTKSGGLGADENLPAPKDLLGVLDGRAGTKGQTFLRNPEVIVIQGKRLKNTKFDIPIVINSAVEDWVDYFTGRGRKYFEKYLERSEYFIPYIEPILKENGMPKDLVYLAMIESGFNNLAKSHAKAVGPWQFMAATGKRYGLGVNWWVDERRDIRKSTIGAVEYLRDLYNMFQSWELAAAAYNAGEYKIARAIQRYGSRDFWTLARHRYLKAETRNYVPKMMAAALISENREQFGFKGSAHRPEADEAIASDGEIVKVIKTDKPLEDGQDRLEEVLKAELPAEVSEEDRKKLAQEALSRVRDSNNPDDEEGDSSDEDGNSAPPKEVHAAPTETPQPQAQMAKVIATPHITKEGQVDGIQLAEYEVRTPADLLKIARAAGLSYQTVKLLNPEIMRWCTPPPGVAGKSTYRIKLPVSVKEKFLAAYNHPAFPRQVDFLTYTVKRGETLARIAKYFGIKVDPIAELNSLPSRTPLRKGMKIILPIPNDRSRSIASLEIRDPPEKRKKKSYSSGKKKAYRVTKKQREAARVSN